VSAVPPAGGLHEQSAAGPGGKRYEGEEVVERLRQRMEQEDQQQEYRKRSQSVELGYADLKTQSRPA